MKNLKLIREKKGLSVTELAKKLNVSMVCIWRWETGQRTPSIKRLAILAAVLDTTPNELLGIEKAANE